MRSSSNTFCMNDNWKILVVYEYINDLKYKKQKYFGFSSAVATDYIYYLKIDIHLGSLG